MRKFCVLFLALAASGCGHKTSVPTTDQLMGNRQLLAEWQAKCDTGEFSQLAAADKDSMCFSTREATRSLAIKKMNGL